MFCPRHQSPEEMFAARSKTLDGPDAAYQLKVMEVFCDLPKRPFAKNIRKKLMLRALFRACDVSYRPWKAERMLPFVIEDMAGFNDMLPSGWWKGKKLPPQNKHAVRRALKPYLLLCTTKL